MGLAGARNSAVTGLQSQSTNISISADNIANAATPGYKAAKGQFSTLVTNSGASTGYSSGGVSVKAKTYVEAQGLVEATGRATDLAISGLGFFPVQDSSGNLLLTRAGSFDVNNLGLLTNSAGFTLLAWPLDSDGRRPGAIGNSNTTAAESTDSLTAVDTNVASGTASATTTINIGMNLNAGEKTFQGSTVTIAPASIANSTISQSDIIVPGNGMADGDRFSLTSGPETTTFTYGGFAKSGDMSNASIFGATTGGTTFATGANLANGDKFTISTVSSGTVTFTFQQSSPDTTSGQFNNLDSLATAINNTVGLTARVSGTTLYVSSDNANEAITFGDVNNSNLHNELGFSNVASGNNRYNTMIGLNNLVSSTARLNSIINKPNSGATIEIFGRDPQQTLTLTKLYGQTDVNIISKENGTITENGLIIPVNGSDMTIGTSSVSFSDGVNSGTFIYGGIDVGSTVSTGTPIFNATDISTAFSGGAITNGDTFTIDDGSGATTFTYVAANPNTANGEFNSVESLVQALDLSTDYRARLVDGTIYVSAENASLGLTYANVDTTDFITAFGFNNIGAVANRFASLSELNAYIDGITNFDTTLTTGVNPNLAIATANGNQITIGGASNTDLLAELGLASGAVGDGLFSEFALTGVVAAGVEDGTVSVSYDPTDDTKNMAGGNVTSHFPRNIQIFDSLGTAHDFRLAFLKTGSNQWSVELYALNPSEVSNALTSNGLIAYGTVTFNGDGSLASISSQLSDAIDIAWSTGASASEINLDLGTAGAIAGTVGAATIGLTDGIRQFDSAYNVEFIEQNGVAAGQFKGITVDEDGTIYANFSNGQIKAIYQIPMVVVANQNALLQRTGNVFAATQASGDINLKVAGQGGSGTIVPGSLEGSTADIAEELTKTIGMQANYNANATLISTVKAMEEELNRRL